VQAVERKLSERKVSLLNIDVFTKTNDRKRGPFHKPVAVSLKRNGKEQG
jgi:hypothetical protein